MLWKKPNDMKFTDLCIFVDQNVPKITNPGENPQLEETIYNYLWLLVKALAIKKCMFTNFQDYDMYAFYSASRLFMALRKNQLNQGKTIKGKLIRPIKSCLNYTKALMYPMKIEYQRESYREIIEEEFVSTKFDSMAFKERLKDQARDCIGINTHFKNYVEETLKQNGRLLDEVLQKSPFHKDSPEYRNLKISILLTSFQILKTKKKLNASPQSVILWHLPKSMSNYTKVLLKEFFTKIKIEIIDCYKEADMSDTDLENIITGTTESWTNDEE